MRIASLALVVVLLVSAVTTPVAGHPGPENDPPLADAGLDQTVERGATVWLDGGGSLDPDGEIESYRWAIETPTGDTIDPDDPDAVSTTFVPESVGRYAVTLTVTDDHGVTRNDTLYVEVSSRSGSDPADAPANESPPHANEPPTGGIAGPDTVTSGEPTTFTADVYDPDGDVVSYAWSDGQSGAEVTKTVDIPPGETFAFSVRATDDDGATRTFRKTVEVRAEGGPSGREPTIDPANQQPSVRIVGPDRVATNQSVTYALAGSDPDGRIVRWEWPGRPATGPSIDLAWTTPTTVTLRGVVTDDDGATAVATKTVEVYDEGPPVVDITGPDTAPVGTTQEYTLEAYDPDGGNLTISWDPSQNQLERASDRFVNHVGIEGILGDTVVVRATVTDDEGNTVIAVKETEVEKSAGAEQGQGVPQLSKIRWGYVHDAPTRTGDADTIEHATYEFAASVSHNESKLVRARWTVNDSVESGYTESLGRFHGSKTTGIEHTFVSETGGMVSREVTVRVVDADGQRDKQKWVSRVHSVQSHDDVVFSARASRDGPPKSNVRVEPGQEVVFTVGAYQNYRLVFGDGTSTEGAGTPGKTNVAIPHTYDDPGTYTVRLISTQGSEGEAIGTATVTVRPRTYVEYWYDVRSGKTDQVVSEDLPSNADWRRVTIHDSGRTYTGRTVTFPQDSGRLAMLDESWKLNATTHEERTRRITRIEKSDPDGSGDEWTLVERDVHTETRVYYEDRYEWYDSKFDRAGWTYTGQVRTDRVVIGDGHDHDRQKHRRTTRSCSNWDLDVGPFGGFSKKCDEWDYDTETWYTGHDHDGRTYYDTEYQYKTEVERTKTVTYHKYAGEETRTVTLKTFAETEPWVEWLWEKDSGEVEERYALEEPRSGSYIAGTLRVVEVRCGSEESHHDEVMC